MTRKLGDPPKISRLGKSNTINSGRQKPFTFMPCHVQCTDFTNIVSFHANNNHKKWVLVLQIFYLTYILYVMYIINYNMKYYWLYIINFVSFSTIHEVLMETILGWFVTLSSSLEKSLMLWKIEGRRRGHQRMRWLGGITVYRHKLGQISGDDEGQRDLACCHPWGRKELDTTRCLNKIK